MNMLFTIIPIALLCGCAGGPTKDYYNQSASNPPRFAGAVTIDHVADIESAQRTAVADGYTIIGKTDYGGDLPKTVELIAQAHRVHANHVIYSTVWIPAKEGSWRFGLGGGFASGGTVNGNYGVHIIFMGK